MNLETILRQLAIAEAAATARVCDATYSYEPEYHQHIFGDEIVFEIGSHRRAKIELTVYVNNLPREAAPSPEETLLAAARAVLKHSDVLTDDELFERMTIWFGERVHDSSGRRPRPT